MRYIVELITDTCCLFQKIFSTYRNKMPLSKLLRTIENKATYR